MLLIYIPVIFLYNWKENSPMSRAHIEYIAAMLIFGFNGVLASAIPWRSYEIVLSRTVIGSLFMLAVMLIRKRPFVFRQEMKSFKILMVSGIAMGFNWMCLYEAYNQLGVGLAQLICCSGPAVAMLLSPFILKEKLRAYKMLGFAAVAFGMLLTCSNDLSGGLNFGLLCGIVWYTGGTVVGADQELLQTMIGTGSLPQMIGVLTANVIMALTDSALFAYALGYLKSEQADGTPFTHRGAKQIRQLGMRYIVLPLVATILIAVVYGVFDIPSNLGGDWSNASGITTGIVLILASLIFSYGAELEEKVK